MINRDEFLNEIKEEQRLRKVLRVLLKEFLNEKKDKKMLEENRFRKIIRSMVKEALSADVADEQPQRSTGINALRALLKNIIPTVEDAYKELTTSKEQRDSFRAHILNAVDNSLKPSTVNLKASDEAAEDLAEEVDVPIDIESDDIDVEEDKFIPARPEDEEVEEVETETPDNFQDITDMDITGRNFAATTFNKVEKQILDAYEDIYADESDRNEFRDYLLTNFKLYFDRFEEELQPSPTEPESPGYSPAKDEDVDMGQLGL